MPSLTKDRVAIFSVVAMALVFAGASLCCGLADNIYLLIVLRAIQAAGGAARRRARRPQAGRR